MLKEKYTLVAKHRILLLFERCLHYKKLQFAKLLLTEDIKDVNLDYLFEVVSYP